MMLARVHHLRSIYRSVSQSVIILIDLPDGGLADRRLPLLVVAAPHHTHHHRIISGYPPQPSSTHLPPPPPATAASIAFAFAGLGPSRAFAC